jgi:hypothetical protein
MLRAKWIVLTRFHGSFIEHHRRSVPYSGRAQMGPIGFRFEPAGREIELHGSCQSPPTSIKSEIPFDWIHSGENGGGPDLSISDRVSSKDPEDAHDSVLKLGKVTLDVWNVRTYSKLVIKIDDTFALFQRPNKQCSDGTRQDFGANRAIDLLQSSGRTGW